MTQFIAKRTAKDVPIWDLLDGDKDIGVLTVFPGEGPMATVHDEATGRKTTIHNAASIHEALVRAKEAYLDFFNPIFLAWEAEQMEKYQDEDQIEDEDGEIARMRHLENKAAAFYDYHYGDEPH